MAIGHVGVGWTADYAFGSNPPYEFWSGIAARAAPGASASVMTRQISRRNPCIFQIPCGYRYV